MPTDAVTRLGLDECDQLPSTECVGLNQRGRVECRRGIETNPRHVGHQV